MIPTANVQNRLADLRAKAMNGSATIEDYREAITLMRNERASAFIASKAKKAAGGTRRKSSTPVNTDALFDELDNMS